MFNPLGQTTFRHLVLAQLVAFRAGVTRGLRIHLATPRLRGLMAIA